MNMHLLGITAIFTLVLNLFLTMYLLRDKIYVNSHHENKKEIINFVLTPSGSKEMVTETEVISTEIMTLGDNENG